MNSKLSYPSLNVEKTKKQPNSLLNNQIRNLNHFQVFYISDDE